METKTEADSELCLKLEIEDLEMEVEEAKPEKSPRGISSGQSKLGKRSHNM